MNLNNKYAMDFYMKQEQKRKDSMKNQSIFLINSELNKFFLKTFHDFSKSIENIDEVKSKINQYSNRNGLVQSNLFRLQYRNNFENIEIAVLQYTFIEWMFKVLEKENKYQYMKNRIISIDFSVGNNFKKHDKYLDSIEIKKN